jgi:hypothetical protein
VIAISLMCRFLPYRHAPADELRVGSTHSLHFTIEMATPSDIRRRYGDEPGQIVDLETRWERIASRSRRGVPVPSLVTSWAPARRSGAQRPQRQPPRVRCDRRIARPSADRAAVLCPSGPAVNASLRLRPHPVQTAARLARSKPRVETWSTSGQRVDPQPEPQRHRAV